MLITERKLRAVIRRELLSESSTTFMADVDHFLQVADNLLTAADLATAAASLTAVGAPAALAAHSVINVASAATDIAQAFVALAKSPPDWEGFWVNGASAAISLLVDHAIAKVISQGAGPIVITAWKRRELIVTLGMAAIDWWVSQGKIKPTDAEEIKKVIKKNLEPDIGESENIDDGESDGSPDPILPALPQQPRPALPSSKSSDCPVSGRFAFKYDGWDGSIWDMPRKAAVTVDLNTGTLLGNTGWMIKNVQTDTEGRPTLVKIIHTSGKCLRVLPLNSLE